MPPDPFMLAQCVLVLIWVITIWSHGAAGQTAYIVAGMSVSYNPANHSFARLATALRSQNYSTILLTGDCRISPASYPQDAPINLTKSLTIGTANYSQRGYTVLETEYLASRVVLAPNVTLTLQDIALGRARKTSGQGIPFFTGVGLSSVLVLNNVVRVRQACAPNSQELVNTLESAPRPPGSNGTNIVSIVDFPYRGKVYPGSVHAVDVAGVVTPGDVADTSAYYAGYVITQTNATRVCLEYVSPDCVTSKGSDQCVTDAVNAMLAAEARPAGAGQPPLAAIVAPVVVGGVLLVMGGVAAWLLVRRRRRRRRAAAAAAAGAAVKDKSDQHQKQQLLQASLEGKGQHNSDPTDITGVHGGAAGSLESLAVGSRGGGWKLLACHTSPEFRDATPNDRIKLGLLLGAGSFGRVYKGVWHNMTVAVKVLQHDSTTAAAISNEVDLVMSFRHPNIVAAYHFVTWTQSGGAREEQDKDKQRRSMDKSFESSSAASGVSPGQARALNAQQSTGQSDSMQRTKLKTVAEGMTSSSRLSCPRPPYVVVSGKDDSALASTAAGSTLASSLGARDSSTIGSTVGASAGGASAHDSSSSNVSAVLAAGGGGSGSLPAAAGWQHGSVSAAGGNRAAPAVNRAGSYGQGGATGGTTVLAHSGRQAPQLLQVPQANLYSPGTISLRPPPASATGSSPRAAAATPWPAGVSPQPAPSPAPSAAYQLGYSNEAPAAAPAVAGSMPAAAASNRMTGASTAHQGVVRRPPAAMLPLPHPASAGSGESSSSAGAELLIRIGPPSDPKLPFTMADKVPAHFPAPRHPFTGAQPTAAAAVAAQLAQQPGRHEPESQAAAAAAPPPSQAGSRSTAGGLAEGVQDVPAWPILSLPLSAARQPPPAAAAVAQTPASPYAPAAYGSSSRSGYSQGRPPSSSSRPPLASPPAAAAAAASPAAEATGSGGPTNTDATATFSSPATPGFGAAGGGVGDLVPMFPMPVAQGDFQVVPLIPAQLQDQGQQQQQQQRHHYHVVMQQHPAQGQAAEPGSGWRAVGDDLEMDEHGNLYSIPGNATAKAAGNGRDNPAGPAAAGNGAGGAARRSSLSGSAGGIAAGQQATEAQTWLILEYCDGGTLLDLLQDGRLEDKKGGGRRMAPVLTLLHDIAAGMNYLHSRSVIHGDLKPGNVLIKHEQGAPYGRVAKVSDFGLSRALQVGQSHRSTRTMGTMNHTPPELLRLGRLSPAGDVYAFGIIMWEVFTGQVAFSGLHYGEVFEQVALWQKRPPVPPEMPPDYAELTISCWAADPFARPPFSAVQQRLQQLLEHVVLDEQQAQERFVSDL